MIKKQNLWFLTLFSLILVLGVYYVTMPNEIIVNSSKETEKIDAIIEIQDNEYLTALNAEQETERQAMKEELEAVLSNKETPTEQKNNAYLKLKYLNELNGEEELLEKKIKEKYELDSFVEIDNDNISVIIMKETHDALLANNIMRLVQENYDTKKIISVKFQT